MNPAHRRILFRQLPVMMVLALGWSRIACAAPIQPTYQFQTLIVPTGALGGVTAIAIEDGTILGTSTNGSNPSTRSFLYDLATKKFTILDDAAAGNSTYRGTYATAISGGNIIGKYRASNGLGPLSRGLGSGEFVYNIAVKTFTAIEGPAGMPGSWDVSLADISGSRIVGSYQANSDGLGFRTRGFIFDLAAKSYTILEGPKGIEANKRCTTVAIADGYVVGSFLDSTANEHSFLYNLATQSYTTMDAPSAGTGIISVPSIGGIGLTQLGTFAMSVSGGNVVGYYAKDVNGAYGFMYNIAARTYTDLNAPGAGKTINGGTRPAGISGNVVAGSFTDGGNVQHGFLYDIVTKTYAIIDAPEAGTAMNQGTFVTGISKGILVGGYWDAKGERHGFYATPVAKQ